MPKVTKFVSDIQRKNVLNKQNVGHTYISFILLILSSFIMLYIGLKYYNDVDEYSRSFANYSFILAIFGLLGFISIDYFDNYNIDFFPKHFNEFNNFIFVMVTMMILVLGIIVDAILQITINYALSDIDLVLYYVFAGVCEEAFFRGFLINMVIGVFTKKGQKPKLIVLFFALVISSFSFMFAHLAVYGNNIAMLLSTLFGGFILGTLYIIYRDISANMCGHCLKNSIGVINLVRF